MTASRACCILVFASVLALGACSESDTSTAAASSHFQGSLAPHQAVSLEIDGRVGAGVSITGGTSRNVQVDAFPNGSFSRGLTISTLNDQDWLHIRIDAAGYKRSFFNFFRHSEAKIDVSVPKDAQLAVTLTNGAVTVESVSGPLGIRLVNGSIDVSGAGDVLDLHLINGAISADIADTSRVPAIDLHGTNGSIDLTVPKDFRARVRARTLIGPIDQAVPSSDGPGLATLQLVTGPISIQER